MSFRFPHRLSFAMSGLLMMALLMAVASAVSSGPSYGPGGGAGSVMAGMTAGAKAIVPGELGVASAGSGHDASPCPGHGGGPRLPHHDGIFCPLCACAPLAGDLPSASLAPRPDRVTVLRFEASAVASPAGIHATPTVPPPRTRA